MVPHNFAKIVHATDGRQVLAVLQENADEDLIELLIVTSIDGQRAQLTFKYSSDTAWDMAEEALARFDQPFADKVVRHFVNALQGINALPV